MPDENGKPITQERQPGPTPLGGVASITYFKDKDGKPVDKEEAESIEVVEVDEFGISLGRTYLTKN